MILPLYSVIGGFGSMILLPMIGLIARSDVWIIIDWIFGMSVFFANDIAMSLIVVCVTRRSRVITLLTLSTLSSRKFNFLLDIPTLPALLLLLLSISILDFE